MNAQQADIWNPWNSSPYKAVINRKASTLSRPRRRGNAQNRKNGPVLSLARLSLAWFPAVLPVVVWVDGCDLRLTMLQDMLQGPAVTPCKMTVILGIGRERLQLGKADRGLLSMLSF